MSGGGKVENPFLYQHRAVWRKDVDPVGQNLVAAFNFSDRKPGAARQYLGQMTLILGGQMGNKHERHARLRRQSVQELLKRLKPAGGSADGDYGERFRVIAGFHSDSRYYTIFG
ncbi:MAG: hypothetical protein A2X34_02370 [Elusimicrobia bacterium GWC2_51_8]|nr:MAG: hypothetical protein A2X34_02370 [Elusimicrobia bacterium GWC2_51_8]